VGDCFGRHCWPSCCCGGCTGWCGRFRVLGGGAGGGLLLLLLWLLRLRLRLYGCGNGV
jgi:hypothetical protein